MASEDNRSMQTTGIGHEERTFEKPASNSSNAPPMDRSIQLSVAGDKAFKMSRQRYNHRSSRSGDSVINHSYTKTRNNELRVPETEQVTTSEYNLKPILPDPISPDAAASMLFMRSSDPEKEIFRGRAKFLADNLEDELRTRRSPCIGQAAVLDPTAQQAVPAQASPLQFAANPTLSMMSRSLANMSISCEDRFPIQTSRCFSLPQSPTIRESKNQSSSSLSSTVSSEQIEYEATVAARNVLGRPRIGMDGSVERLTGHTLSPIPFTESPASITREGSEAGDEGSFLSDKTHRTSENHYVWIPEELLKFTNIVRAALPIATVPRDDFIQLKGLIEHLSGDKISAEMPENIQLNMISHTRLDKLMEEIINLKNADAQYDRIVAKTLKLQRKWKQEFGGYHLIDEQRFQAMTTRGILRDMYCSVYNGTGLVVWKNSRKSRVVETELTPGQWWPNMTCVFRDGFVNSIHAELTIGSYNNPVLPLLSGEEVHGPEVGMYTYTSKSRKIFGPFEVVPAFGTKINVLRGHDLKSLYAPKVGIRYDGEYTLSSYRLFPRDPDAEMSMYQIILKRIPGQVSVNVLQDIPTPAQMDEWNLYQKHTKEVQAQNAPQTFFTQLLGKVARSPDPSPPKVTSDKDMAKIDFSFDDVFQ